MPAAPGLAGYRPVMADPAALPRYGEDNDPTPWRDPTWRAGFRQWITDAVAAAGARLASLGPTRVRPWSVTLPVDTDRGRWWAKANPPGSAFEPALVTAIGRWAADSVIAPVAVDADRAFGLIPDGGPVLRDQPIPPNDLTAWETPISAYADLQRRLAIHADDLLALGVPDYRPPHLPRVLTRLLARPTVRTGIDWSAIPLDQWCAELSASPVPITIDHSDLHGGHVFSTGGPRFFDWGDANVGHPFTSLLVILRSARSMTTLAPEAPAFARLIDAYLEPWSDLDTPTALRRTVAVALRVAPISRADSWQRVFDTVDDRVRADHDANSASWLGNLAQPDWSA